MSNALTFKTLYICWDLLEWFLFLITDGCETTFRTCYFCELNQWAYQGNPDKGTLLLWNNLNCFLYILSPFDYILIGNLCLQSVYYQLLKKKKRRKSQHPIYSRHAFICPLSKMCYTKLFIPANHFHIGLNLVSMYGFFPLYHTLRLS